MCKTLTGWQTVRSKCLSRGCESVCVPSVYTQNGSRVTRTHFCTSQRKLFEINELCNNQLKDNGLLNAMLYGLRVERIKEKKIHIKCVYAVCLAVVSGPGLCGRGIDT